MYPTSRRTAMLTGIGAMVFGTGQILRNLNEDRERENRPLPQGRGLQPTRMVTLPDVQGQPVAQAIQTFREQGLVAKVDGVWADATLKGPVLGRTVVDMSIAPGTPVDQYTVVNLSTGPR